MVAFLGTPTLFFTLSAADLHWPELYRLIAPDVDFNLVDPRQATILRNKFLNENPLIVSWFFHYRADLFIDKMMGPHFNVKDYWYRTEFQHRGSPHIHGILWLEGAPDVSSLDHKSDEERLRINAAYFGNLVTTTNPNINKPLPVIHPCQRHFSDIDDHEDDYGNLVNCCQRHTRHSKQCLRINKTTKLQECRYKFPFELHEEHQLVKENEEWTFKSARNDPLINSHNRFVCEHWRANTDMQCILSTNVVLKYIAKYASKSETRSKAFEELYSMSLDNQTEGHAKEVLQKFFLKICAERDISAQETFHILMGWPLYHASRAFVKINVEGDRLIRINADEPGETTAKSVLENYPHRPQHLDGMCLKEVFSKLYKKGDSWITRRKPAVPRIMPRHSLNTESEEKFYKQLVILHVPWRSLTEFTDSEKTWKELYVENINNREPLQIPDHVNEYEEIEFDDDEREHEEWMLLAQMGPYQRTISEVELGLRELDVHTNWDASYNSYPEPANLASFISESKAHSEEHPALFEMPKITLNNEQNTILNSLRCQINVIKRGGTVTSSDQSMIVQGKAGSGKSTVISAMCHLLSNELGVKSFLLMAPTGAAAVNIQGCTIHSALHIGIDRTFKNLDGEAALAFQRGMRDCQFIIIDEMSMVGCSLLNKIDQRCRQAKPQNAHKPFGGMCLYLLGDLKQLPPVMDRALYGKGYNSSFADQGQILYQSITKCVILATSHRQHGDDQTQFRDVLDRLSLGKSTVTDWNLLMTREKSQVNMTLFKEALKILPFNEGVQSHNLSKLKSLNEPVAKIKSKNNNATAEKAETDVAQGLEKTLYLSVGSRVMLKNNIWVAKGLVNGALGYVRDIVYVPGSAPPQDMPIAICVSFDKYTGPTIAGLVPVPPVTRSWKTGDCACSRNQFPLSLAWAVTVHKSQGLTLERVIVDIGDRELAAGCTYVALSRCKKLEHLAFERGFDFKRLESIKKMKALQQRIEEEERLTKLATGTS